MVPGRSALRFGVGVPTVRGDEVRSPPIAVSDGSFSRQRVRQGKTDGRRFCSGTFLRRDGAPRRQEGALSGGNETVLGKQAIRFRDGFFRWRQGGGAFIVNGLRVEKSRLERTGHSDTTIWGGAVEDCRNR